MNNDLIRRGDVLKAFDENIIWGAPRIAIENIPAVPQPMSAVEFIKQFSRMCSSYPAYGNDTGCKGCPLEYDSTCDLLRSERAEHYVEVTQKWVQEHPEEVEE